MVTETWLNQKPHKRKNKYKVDAILLLVSVVTVMAGPIKTLIKAKQKPNCVLNVTCCGF